MHAFEKAQLGIAPFTATQYQELVHELKTPQGVIFRAGGQCDYCGTSIRHAYWIQGSCGEKFKVGSSCVAKVDSALASEMKEMRLAIQREKRTAAYKAKQEKFAAMTAELEKYAQNRAGEFFGRIERDGSFITNFDALRSFAVVCMEEYLHGRRVSLEIQNQAWRIKSEIIDLAKKHVQDLANAELESAKKRHKSHVGTVGAKIEVQARHIGSFSYETQWGTSWVRKFEDTDGNLLVWFTGSSPKWFTKDFNGVLKATVKDHGQRDGEAQTIITRPKGEACAY
tara:strand:+ start:3228 stop:4076 length:849 start_codon:yes stop_codon:yes gene_type:complete